MKKLVSMKKAAAVCCAVSMAMGSLSGCGKSDYALKCGDNEIKAGVYIASIINEMNTQMNTLYYAGQIQSAEEAMDQKIDGKAFADVVKENALENAKEVVAVDAKFSELGLELTADDVAAIDSAMSSAWSSNSGMYEYAGVSKESFQMTVEHDYKKSAIFDYYYAEGGIEEVPNSDIQTYVNDNYIRYKIISFSKSTAEDEETQKTENEEAEALLEEYYEKAQDVDFAGFDALIDEYNAYKEAKAAEEEAAASEESGDGDIALEEGAEDGSEDMTDTESSEDSSETESSEDSSKDSKESESKESDESSEETESEEGKGEESVEETNAAAADTSEETVEGTSESKEEESSEEDKKEESSEKSSEKETESKESDEADTDTEADSETDSETEVEDGAETDSETESEAEEEADPYANEYIMNATDMLDENSENYDESYAAMIKAFKDQPYNKAAKYTENEYSYVLFITDDIAGRTDYVQENKDNLLQEIKGDDFDGLIKDWVNSLGIKVNEQAIKKYTVKEIYDRQEEYYKKNPS